MDNNFLDDDSSEEIIDEADDFEADYLFGDPFVPISSDESNPASTMGQEDTAAASAASTTSPSSSLSSLQRQESFNFDADQLKCLTDYNLDSFSQQLLSKAGTGDLLTSLHKHWQTYVPICFNVSDNPLKNLIETDVEKILLKPMAIFICNNTDSDKALSKLNELDEPPQLCGKVFKSGEPSYFCRDCGSDPTCVLCSNCFRKSKHREHKYKMMTSGGGGYCDCGDPEAWKQHPCCELHMPKQKDQNSSSSSDYISKLPKDIEQRATQLFSFLFDYIFEMLSIDKTEHLPDHLKPEKISDDYVTMLYNDEIHSYEQVVSTLRKVLNVDDKKAFEYAAIVDKEGRSAIKRGKKIDCSTVKEKVEKTMSSPQTSPLDTKVLHHSLVTHQYFAEKILIWLQKICEYSKGLKHILCNIGLFVKPEGHSVVEKLMLSDTIFWKSVRSITHQFFISVFFMDPHWKKEFAILYTKNYKLIWRNYVKNPDDTVSLTDLAVQMFTVISLSKHLVANYNLLQTVMETLIEHSKTNKGKLSFPRNRPKSHPEFKRAQFILYDLKYCLTATPDDWSTDLRINFINGFKSFVEFMKFMHGMDSLTRQTQTHIEYEPEWETSFNLLIKLQKSISALIEWCSSDRSVYLECYKYLLHTIQQVETTETQFKYNYAKKHLVIDSTSYQYEIIDYSIMKQEVSIHATLTRLFSAVFMHMEKFDLNFNSIFNEIYPGKQDASSKQKMIALLEPSIRALVLVSQTNAGLWKRNGFSLLSQVYFYSNIKCRHEMFDRDILCLQMGASVMDPNEFLVNLLVHYSLYDYFMDEKFDLETGATTSDSKSDTELKQPEHFIPISEDFLELLIHILSERYDSKISKVEQNKRLEREVIHQLCVSPMAHSDLVKNIYPDNEKYTSDLEAVLNRIAFFKTSAPTSNAKGVYELKEEYLNYYSPYFYHYVRAEKTKSEEQQLSLRKNEKEKFFKPARLPPLTNLFAKMSHLLDSDVFIQIMFTIIQRFINKSKFSSEGQLSRLLHLIGLALHEEQDDLDQASSSEYSFKFLYKSVFDYKPILTKTSNISDIFTIKSFKPGDSTLNLTKTIDNLVGMETLTEQYKLLAVWLNDYAKRLVKLKTKLSGDQFAKSSKQLNKAGSIDEPTEMTSPDQDDLNEENILKEKRKNLIAEKRRAKILAQLNLQQKNFIKNNQEFYDEAKACSSSVGSGPEFTFFSSKMEVATNEIVAIGPHQYVNKINENSKKLYHCILCQEDEAISVNMPPMVLCTYVQNSKVLSKNRQRSIELAKVDSSFDPLLVDSSLFWGIHSTSCGHVMHASCWQKYVDTVKLNENRRHNRYFGFNVKKNEYLCPLCETVGNSVLPLFPDLKELSKSTALANKSEEIFEEDEPMTFKKQKVTSFLTYEDWLDGLVKTLENTVKKEHQDNKDVFIINPCPLSSITKLMVDSVANNFKTLFEFDTYISGIGSSTGVAGSTNLLHAETLNAMESFTRASYTIGFNQSTNDIDSRMPIAVWSNCAYTIRATEQLLRIDSKNLFGQFSLKQAELLSNIVKQSALYGITSSKHTESVRQSCVRLLASILPYKQESSQAVFDNEPKNVLCMDMLQLLVNLCISMPNLYDKPNMSSVPNGGLNDFNIFKLVLQAHCFQICLIKLIKSNTGSVSIANKEETIEESDHSEMSQNEIRCYEFYKYLADLAIEKNILVTSNLKLLSCKKLYETLKTSLMPFLRCSALFFGNLTDLAPSINITSNPDDINENFNGLITFLGLTNTNNLGSILDIQPSFKNLCNFWISNIPALNSVSIGQLIDHPISENKFIDLPVDFVDLVSMSMSSHTCLSRPSSLMSSSESATILCLICGEMLCSQTFCCLQEIGTKRVGSCTAHAYKCGLTVGMFLRVAECQVLLLHLNSIQPDDLQVRGCFVPAPYLDDYGETDQGLRRGNPLHLCPIRYKKLYRDWLSHAIPDEVSRSYQSQSNVIHMDWIQF